MAQTDEAPEFRPVPTTDPAPRERKFLVMAVVAVDEETWQRSYGGITNEGVAQWLTFQFIEGSQQGVDVLSLTEVPADAPDFSKIAIASNNG